MPSLKNFTQGIRRDLKDFTQSFSEEIIQASYELSTSTFKKTRFSSHVHFLSRCLRSKVIPNGFKIKFHSSVQSATIQKHLNCCSKNLIRSTLQDYQKIIKEHSDKLPNFVNRLRFLCSNYETFLLIRKKIHDLNQALYDNLKETKDRKFEDLLSTVKQKTTNSENTQHKNIVQTIPEDLPLTPAERNVLNKGLKFVPQRQNIDEFQAKHDTEAFFRRLRLKAHFFKEDSEESSQPVNDSLASSPEPDDIATINSLFPTKSAWTPKPGKLSALDLYIDKCRYEISQINFKAKCKKSNLTQEEWSALKHLKSREDIVIKPADKGGRIVVWRKDLYNQEGNSQLQTTSYDNLQKNLTKTYNKTIINTIKEEMLLENLPYNADKLIPSKHMQRIHFVLPTKTPAPYLFQR